MTHRVASGRVFVIAAITVLAAGCAHQQPTEAPDSEFAAITDSELKRFANAAEFNAYFRAVHDLAAENSLWWASLPGVRNSSTLLAQDELPCDPSDEECLELEEVIVMSSSTSSAPMSITNNQEVGVDEGDIVKHFKNFLIVLQHGRLFSISLGQDASTMELVDRVNLYTSDEDDTWYDELLIAENRLVVTGFSYGEDLTEISVFEISDDGVFSRVVTYEITSRDYFSGDNYATRLVDNHLVIYTPLNLFEYEVDEGVIFPIYRQVDTDGSATTWQPLFGPEDIFWPIQNTLLPVVHTISVCSLREENAFTCNSSGLVGPDRREFYVTPNDAYVWISESRWELSEFDSWTWDCPDGTVPNDIEAVHSAVYRIPLFGDEVLASRTRGAPPDQFSLDGRGADFHALLAWTPRNCSQYDGLAMRHLKLEQRDFSKSPRLMPDDRYTQLPPVNDRWISNRFTGEFIVYSDNTDYKSGGDWFSRADLIAVPIENPSTSFRIPLEHSVDRLEVFGNGLIANGYIYDDGLFLSSIRLDQQPRVADREFMPAYFESEGRSHAFNLIVDESGSGMFGVPVSIVEPYRSWFVMRDNSDIAFFSVNADMTMDTAGMLESTPDLENENYECEVSCYDWYGNARPIFLYDRIFALSGSELIEGALINGQVTDQGRVSLMSRPSHAR